MVHYYDYHIYRNHCTKHDRLSYSRWGIAGDLCEVERTLFGLVPFWFFRYTHGMVIRAFDVESQLYLTTPSVADGDIRHGHDLLLDPTSSALFRLQLTPVWASHMNRVVKWDATIYRANPVEHNNSTQPHLLVELRLYTFPGSFTFALATPFYILCPRGPSGLSSVSFLGSFR